MEVYFVNAANVDKAWPLMEEYVQKACDRSHGRLTAEDVHALVSDNKMQGWIVAEGNDIRCVVITETLQYPRRKVCRVVSCAGTGARDWVHLLNPTVEEWAKEAGCDGMEVMGRKGWERLLPDYERTLTILEKTL